MFGNIDKCTVGCRKRELNNACSWQSGLGRSELRLVGFFFSSRRRHTRCGRDWSSDVCSSDLLEPLLKPELDHLQTIRIGTKSLTFWPQRFVTDDDADEVLALFKKLVDGGKHIAFMAHFNHWQEMETPIVREAIRRIRATGAVIRAQAPLVKHINDDPKVWERLWRTQVRLGLIPYYMFVERDTGAKRYFEVPLARTYEVYQQAIQRVSGLGRTVRGPSMSAGPGKVEIQGITEIQGEKVFMLRFIQGRNPDWVQRPFFAKFDPEAMWFDDLVPAFGEEKFFFTDEYETMSSDQGEAEAIY